MEFKIEKEEFLKGLSRIQSIVERKVTMPILSNALIETKPTGILITATDLEIGLQDSTAVILSNLALDEGRMVYFNEIEKMGKPGPAARPARRS